MYDTDASGLIFFGAPTRLETGSAAVVRAASFAYERPMRLGDTFVHRAGVSRAGLTSFDVSHEISVRGVVTVRAVVTHVSTDLATGEAVPIAGVVRAAAVGSG